MFTDDDNVTIGTPNGGVRHIPVAPRKEKPAKKWKPKNVKLTSIVRLNKYSQAHAPFLTSRWATQTPSQYERKEYERQVSDARKHGHWFPMGTYVPEVSQ